MPQAGLLSQYQFLSFDGGAYSNSGRNLKAWWNFEDFIGGVNAVSNNIGIWSVYFGGGGAIVADGIGELTRPGQVYLGTGATNTGYANLFSSYSSMQPLCFGGGEYAFETDINIPILSTVGEEYILRVGFGDTNNTDFVDGAYYEYDRLTSNNWSVCAASNSARTKTDSGYAVGTGWVRLKIVVNALGTGISFFRNNILVNILGTNIPTGAGRELTAMFQIVKSAGTTPRILYVDWAWLHINLNTSR